MPKKKSKKEIKQLIALEWPSALAFGTLLPDYMLYENPKFNRENTGIGSIEYFGPFEAAFDYNNDYKKKDAPDADFVAPYDRLYSPKYVYNPYGISPTIMYDPNSNTVDDIKLDLLHHYRKVDPVYKSLVDDYTEAIMDNLGDDLIWNSSFPLEYKRYYNGDTKAMQEHMPSYNRGASTIPFNSPFIEQGIDGSLRNLLANDETIENSNYLPREDAEKQWLSTPEARKAFDNIKLYLTTYRLPEVTVTGHKHEDGGALNWEELPMKDRHYYILQGVALGLRDIDSIKESYNLYALGGNIYATKGALKKGSNTPKGGKQRFIELLDKKLADSRYAYFNTPLWRNYFINLVNKESGYNPKAVNKDTGASGYFLIMPQYKWYKNDEELFDLIFLMTKSNLDLIRKSLTKQDLRNLEAMGYDIYGIAGGAHLGGANGLLNFIKRGINAQDANHSSVKGYISSFSQSPKRNMSDTNQLSLLDFSTDTTGYTDLIVTVPDDEVPQQKPIIIEEVPEEPQLPLLTIPVVPTIADTAPVQNTGNSFLLPTLFLSLINLGLVEDPLTYSPKVNTVDIPITATDILKKQKLKLQQKYLDDVDDRYIKNIINSTYLNNSFADGGTAESFLSKLYPSAVAKRLYEDMVINGGTLPEVVVTGDKMRAINNRLNNLYSSYGVNPTDNTWAEPINILLQNEKVQNPQLLREAVEGAKKYNAWRENHPYMATAGDIASTIPVATAAYPVVSPAGSGIATALTNPYVQAGINSYFAAEGVDDIINGRANWSTPINFLPFYWGATKTLANAVGKAYNSGKKVYDTTRLAMGLNNDIRNFTPRYSIKNPRYDIMAAKQGFTPNGISWAEATKPYEIAHYPGYQLKSLMMGNPLEKQLSRWGQINVNNIKSLINKGSNVEKAVVDKVLNSKQFAGKKSIDYNKFRKAVQDELITYNRVPNKKYEDYGMGRLGFNLDKDIWSSGEYDYLFKINNEGQPVWAHSGELLTEREKELFFNKNPYNINTFTFTSERIPQGNATHYDPNTLGHSRTYTLRSEPDILHVMESQSDWGQKVKLKQTIKEDISNTRSNIERVGKKIEDMKRVVDTGYLPNGEQLSPNAVNNIENNIKRAIRYRQQESDKLKDLVDASNIEQALYLNENYTKRQLQENLKYAAEQGQTKMRYPTRETAATIEGYTKSPQYSFEDSFDDVANNWINNLNKNNPDVNWSSASNNDTREAIVEMLERYSDNKQLLSEIMEGEEATFDTETLSLMDKLRGLYKIGEPAFTPQMETILKKYSDFPKQYRKLYKDADVRKVTDGKGNTWYEVDVPKDYLNREWQYSLGGQLRKRSLKSVKHMF